MIRTAAFWGLSATALIAAWRVFRADSMVRAAYWLLLSFAAVAVLLVFLGAEFLGLVLILMMAGEMTIMAVFMVMFMMNPAGLNPMMMVHQHRAAIGIGAAAFLGLAAVGIWGEFPSAPAPESAAATAQLGSELLGNSMLIFETAGVTLLATMIGAIALAARRGRYGDAEAGSVEPKVGALAESKPMAEGPAERGEAMEAMDDHEMPAGHGGHE